VLDKSTTIWKHTQSQKEKGKNEAHARQKEDY
jgi:hypothetical protein